MSTKAFIHHIMLENLDKLSKDERFFVDQSVQNQLQYLLANVDESSDLTHKDNSFLAEVFYVLSKLSSDLELTMENISLGLFWTLFLLSEYNNRFPLDQENNGKHFRRYVVPLQRKIYKIGRFKFK
jgi:hypothetical protein